MICSNVLEIYDRSQHLSFNSDQAGFLVWFCLCLLFLFSQGGSSVFGSLVILDVVCRYLSLFLLYISIKIGTD